MKSPGCRQLFPHQKPASEPETNSPEVIYDDVPDEGLLSPDEDDTVYEDVQRSDNPLGTGQAWSSSEFESYDEHSEGESKLPARSKVPQPLCNAGVSVRCLQSGARCLGSDITPSTWPRYSFPQPGGLTPELDSLSITVEA
ncbi:rho guanine nucleotide exchange factor 10-like protein isoform X1 [Arapaima gigas]